MEFALAGVAIVIVLFLVVIYNRLVTARNTYKNALANIDVALKQRHDMIPALVETVKGAAAHERETLDAVISARNAAETARGDLGASPSPEQIKALATAEGKLNASMTQLFALAEAYPDLRAVESFRDLQDQVARMEDKISSSRRGYNLTVLEYNNTLEVFPNNVVAGMFSFARAQELEFDDAEQIKDMPSISF